MELTPEQDNKFKALCNEIKPGEFGKVIVVFNGAPQNFVQINAEKTYRYHGEKAMPTTNRRFDCMRRVHTPPLWGVSKNVPLTRYVGMYPETNTLPKQPYPVRSAAGLVDFSDAAFFAQAIRLHVRFYQKTKKLFL